MRGDFKSYDLVAISAGRKAGLKGMPLAARAARLDRETREKLVAAVADSPAAVELRDEMFAEFERRLRDSGYGGDQVWQWFLKTYGPIGRTSIYRARASLRAQESRITEVAADAQAYADLAAAEGADAVFDGASLRAGQLMFQLLYMTKAEDFQTTDIGKVAKIITALGKLQKSRAETDMIREKLADVRRKFDAEVKAAQGRKAKGGSGKLDATDIDAIRKAVFGEAA